MIEDSTEEFHKASSKEGGSSLPSPRRHGTVAPPALVTSTPRLENASDTQAMMTVPPQAAAPQLNTGLPFE
jgi:hypothetical protein